MSDVVIRWSGIRDAIDYTDDLVRHVWQNRKDDVIDAYIDGVDSFLPPHIVAIPLSDGVLYTSDNGADIVHYFYEGLDMGPNVYWEEMDRWFTPVPKKHYTGSYLSFSKGTDHWDEEFQNSSDFIDFEEIAKEILRRG